MSKRQVLLNKLRNHDSMSGRDEAVLVAILSLPAILAQLSTIVMQYIDASMVGSLGAQASASIGLVSTTIWLFGGLVSACSTGFYVQVAHRYGASDMKDARAILRESLPSTLGFSILLAIIGTAISPFLPAWLGGPEGVRHDATLYFLVFSLSLPFAALNSLCGGMLRSVGSVHISSILNVLMCALDVLFNALLIFPTRDVSIFGLDITIPGAGWGVLGAVCGTSLSFVICSALMCYFACFRNPELNLRQEIGRYMPRLKTIREALRIASPIGIEHAIKNAAQIMCIIIIAPLGEVAIAANAFGIIIESLCYMPGYGIADAATTLVGQSLGAGRWRLARSFSRLTIGLGIATMSLLAVVMFVFAPNLMTMMSPDIDVQNLTTEVLRIEALAEPMFAASIVTYGVFIGLGQTLIPCCINLSSIWLIRIPLAAIMAGSMGLRGVWIAMAVELSVRGIVFLWQICRYKWHDKISVSNNYN